MNFKFFNQEQSTLKNYFSKEELSFLNFQKDPYWIINGNCLQNKICLFGDFSEKAKEYYKFLFFKSGVSKQNHDSNFLIDLITVDPYELYFGGKSKIVGTKEDPNICPIYSLIPEIKKINRKLSYSELYNSLSLYSDSKLLFINIYKNNSYENLASAVCLFPILPRDISKLNKLLCLDIDLCSKIDNLFTNLANIFNLSFDYPSNKKGFPFNDDYQDQKRSIIQQKLIDLYSLSNDSEDLHGVSYCHNHINSCVNYCSSFCENSLCKECCEVSDILLYYI